MAFNRCALVRFGVEPEVMVAAGAIEFTAVFAQVFLEVAAF